jgi:hypothetical protein
MADGFLGRWSRRKLDVKEGRPVEAEPPAPPAPAPVPAPVAAAPVAAPQVPPAEPVPPAPTLEDVKSLTPESDFRRFAAADTPAEVKNAAMKKLFADPRYNVMDGLDVYIDDYSLPDPMPEKMLRSLASAKFLGLFPEDEAKGQDAAGARATPDVPAGQSVAQSAPPAHPEAPPAVARATPDTEVPHADPDLRLQQDHAPGPQGPGDGPR